MGVSTANRNTTGQVGLAFVDRPVEATTHIYQGTFTCTNAAGNAVMATDTSGLIFDGYAEAEANNTGVAGAINVKTTPRHNGVLGVVECDAVSPDNTWNNQEVALTDDHTVALVGQTSHVVRAGRIVCVVKTGTSGRVWVDTSDISQSALAGT